ncbi:MAG: SMC-Scp complex subunit ScpB [bacterium]|nr:SMC-Scp complex subunit ScpB [bacterium]
MKLSAVLEALLFIAGEPVKIKKLAKIANSKEVDVRAALEELSAAHEERKGLRVLVKDDEAELVTHPDATPVVSEFLKSGMEEDLTDATAETLAIIAYKGPISRAGIDDIRGVNSQYTLRALLVRGLVERLPNPDDARTYLYRISFDFLKKLGVKDVEELPAYGELSQTSLKPSQPAVQESNAVPDASQGS